MPSYLQEGLISLGDFLKNLEEEKTRGGSVSLGEFLQTLEQEKQLKPEVTNRPSEEEILKASEEPGIIESAYKAYQYPKTEGLVQVGKTALSGTLAGAADIYSILDKAAQDISKTTGLSSGGLFKKLSENASYWSDRLDKEGLSQGFIHDVVAGMGGVLPDLTMMSVMGPYGLPVWLATKGAMKEGIPGAFKGTVEGTTLHLGSGATKVLPKILQRPAGATLFGALQPGGVKERATAATLGAILTKPNKNARTIRETLAHSAERFAGKQLEKAELNKDLFIFEPTEKKPYGEAAVIHPSAKDAKQFQLTMFDITSEGQLGRATDDIQFKTKTEAQDYIKKVIEAEPPAAKPEYIPATGAAEHAEEAGWSPEAQNRGLDFYVWKGSKRIQQLDPITGIDYTVKSNEIKFQVDPTTNQITLLDKGAKYEDLAGFGLENVTRQVKEFIEKPVYDLATLQNKFSSGEGVSQKEWDQAVEKYPAETKDFVKKAGDFVSTGLNAVEKSELPDMLRIGENDPIKTLGPSGKGGDRIDKKTFRALTHLKDLPRRIFKYKLEQPIRVFLGDISKPAEYLKEYPFLKDQFYDRLTDGRDTEVRQNKVLQTELKNMQKTLPKKKVSTKNIMINAIAKQEGGEDALRRQGINILPQETPEEANVYAAMRAGYEKKFNELNKARALLGIKPINKIETYFTFQRDPQAIEELIRKQLFEVDPEIVWRTINEPGFEFALSRETEAKIPLALDAFKTYEYYMKKANQYLAVVPTIARAKLLLEPIHYTIGGQEKIFTLRSECPNLANYMKSWVEYGTEKLAPSELNVIVGPTVARTVSRINRNLAMAVLSMNIRSALIQPTQLRNTYTTLGTKDFLRGVSSLFKPNELKFAYQHSRHLQTRYNNLQIAQIIGGPYDINQPGKVLRRGIKGAITTVGRGLQKTAEVGLWPLQILDLISAEITWSGAYKQAVAGGLTGRRAFIYADDKTIMTQASASLHDLPPMQRTPIGKLATIFQTFVINEWNWLSHDIVGIRNKRMSGKDRALNITRLVVGTALINALFERGLRVRSPYPAPEWAIYDAITQHKKFGQIGGVLLRELAEQFPIIGGPLRYSTPWKQFYPAGIQVYGDSLQILSKVFSELKWKDIKIEDYAAFGRLFGIPGTGQTEKAIRRLRKGATLFDALIGVRTDKIKNSITHQDIKDLDDLIRKYGKY